MKTAIVRTTPKSTSVRSNFGSSISTIARCCQHARDHYHGSLLTHVTLRNHVRFVESCRIDPMHTYFWHGIFSDEMYKFLEFCRQLLGQDQWGPLREFCTNRGWQWPVSIEGKGRAIGELFNNTRMTSSRSANKNQVWRIGSTYLLLYCSQVGTNRD